MSPNRENGYRKKPVKAATEAFELEMPRNELDSRWVKQYPMVIKSRRNKWYNLSVYFKYPEDVRKVIYTINAVEVVRSQVRKLTKTEDDFTNENILLKLFYAGAFNGSEKWAHPMQNGNRILSQMIVHFDNQLENYLNL